MALGPIVFGPILGLIQWFQSNGLIADPLACPVCSTPSSRVNMILEPVKMSVTSIGGGVLNVETNFVCEREVSTTTRDFRYRSG